MAGEGQQSVVTGITDALPVPASHGPRAHDRCALFSGGQRRNHINMWPYGCSGYMSMFMCLRPEISHRYWQAINSLDTLTAREIIAEKEIPFRDYIGEVPGGQNAGFHAAYELRGLCKRYLRPPCYSLSDEEVEAMAQFMDQREFL